MYNAFIVWVLAGSICTTSYANKSKGIFVEIDGINKLDSIDIRTVKGHLKTFPAPTGAATSDTRFTVRVRNANTSWQSLSVYAFFKQYTYNKALTAEPQFVDFESNGGAIVEIDVKEKLDSFTIRPAHANVRVIQTGQKIQLVMTDKARQLCLEINGDKKRPLLLFSNAIETKISSQSSSRVKYFGPGYHKLADGTLNIGKDIDTVYISGGAVLEGAFKIQNTLKLVIRGSGIIFNPVPASGPRNSVFYLANSTNVTVDGIICLNRVDNWSVKTVSSNTISYNNVKIISEIRDGFNILNSQKVRIDNSFIMAHDDAIALKGLAFGENQPVEDILIENSIVANMGGGNGIEIGYESACPAYQHITVKDIDIIYSLPNGDRPDSAWPEAAISIHPSQMTEYKDAVYMSVMPPIRDILYKNIRIESVEDDYLIDIFPQRKSPGQGISNIVFDNVSLAHSDKRPIRIEGRPDHPIRTVKFKNLKLLGEVINKKESGNFILKDADDIMVEK